MIESAWEGFDQRKFFEDGLGDNVHDDLKEEENRGR